MKKNVKSREILQVPAHYRDILVQIMNESYIAGRWAQGRCWGWGRNVGVMLSRDVLNMNTWHRANTNLTPQLLLPDY